MRSPRTATKSSPRSPPLEKAHMGYENFKTLLIAPSKSEFCFTKTNILRWESQDGLWKFFKLQIYFQILKLNFDQYVNRHLILPVKLPKIRQLRMTRYESFGWYFPLGPGEPLKQAGHGCWQQWLTLDPDEESALTEWFHSSIYFR